MKLSMALALCLLLCAVTSAHAHRVNVFAFVEGEAVHIECSFSKSQKVRNGKLTMSDANTGSVLLSAVTDEQGTFSFRPPEEFLRLGHALLITLNAGEGHRNTWEISAEELVALSGSAGSAGLDGSDRDSAMLPPAAKGVSPLWNPHQGDDPPGPRIVSSSDPASVATPAAAPEADSPACVVPGRGAAPVTDSLAGAVPGSVAGSVAGSAVQTARLGDMDAASLERLVERVMDRKLAPVNKALAELENSGPELKDIIGGLGWILGLLGLATYMKHRR